MFRLVNIYVDIADLRAVVSKFTVAFSFVFHVNAESSAAKMANAIQRIEIKKPRYSNFLVLLCHARTKKLPKKFFIYQKLAYLGAKPSDGSRSETVK